MRTSPSAFGHVGWRKAATPVAGVPPVEQEQARQDDALVARLVYSIIVLYSVTFAILSVLQHEAFQTHAFDLGNMDQAVWNTAHGRPLEFTNWSGGSTRLAAHVEPILFLVALAYNIHSGPATLLVIQSLTIGLGALPAFWLARRALESSLAGAVFSFTYLLSPALEIANLADFHPVAMASAFLLFALYYLHVRAYPAFLLCSVLAMATKEHVPLTIFGMGLYIAYLQPPKTGGAGFHPARQVGNLSYRDEPSSQAVAVWRRGHRGLGFAVCALAALWAVVAFGLIIPHFNPDRVSPYLSRYDQLGASPLQVVWKLASDPAGAWAMLTEPAKLEFLRQLFQPTLFLSFLSPPTVALALPDLAINLLSNSPDMYSGSAHYGAVLVPIITAGAVLGAGKLYGIVAAMHPGSRVTARWVLALSVLVASLVSFYDGVLLPLSAHPPTVTAHHQRAKEVLAKVPPDAPVSTSSTLNPHLSQRSGLYLFPEVTNAEYIAVDVTATPYPIDTANQWWRLQGLLASGEWGVAAGDDGVLLLQKAGGGGQAPALRSAGPAPQELPATFYTFTVAREEDVRTKADIPFGPGLTLAGYALRPGGRLHGPNPYATLDLFWRVDQTPQQDFLVEVTLVSPSAVIRSTPTVMLRNEASGGAALALPSFLASVQSDSWNVRVLRADGRENAARERGTSPRATNASLPLGASEAFGRGEEAPLFIDRHQATTVWRLPTTWSPGELIRVHVPRLPLENANEAAIRVALVEREPPHRRIEGPITLTTLTREPPGL